jgi:hypothetical protein
MNRLKSVDDSSRSKSSSFTETRRFFECVGMSVCPKPPNGEEVLTSRQIPGRDHSRQFKVL